ncbi:MAG: ribosomal protein S18-alanine N-acetyltransferase [Pyrinomonadaceae bacterium]
MTHEHVDECWRLDLRCFVDGEAYNRDTFEYLLSAPESTAYCAMSDDNEMIGFIIGLVEPDRTGHITTVAVAPEDRRRGIAERLMRRVEMAFRARGVTVMRLEVRDTNAAGVELYRKLGFTVIHQLVTYYSNGGDGLLMVKSLD